jgi:hypothetical protein
MSKRMTEAAKLYWKDIDVLEEARLELVEYFDRVWSLTWEKISSFFAENDNEKKIKIELYQDRQRPGRYYISLKQGQPANFEVIVSDPRRSDDWRVYNLKIRCYQSHKNKIDKLFQNGRASINTIASSQGVDIDWEQSKNYIYTTNIEIDPDNADLVAEKLIEVIENMFGWITEAYTWMLSQGK